MIAQPSYEELQAEVAALRQLERQARLVRSCVDRAAESIFWVDRDARFIYVNDAACRHLGYSREELLALTVHDVDPVYRVEDWPDFWQQFKEHGSLRFESINRAKDGREYPVEISVRYLTDDGREIMHAYVRDITAHKQAIMAYEKAHSELELRVQGRTAELRRTNEQLESEIAEHRRTAAALRRSTEFSEIVLNSMSDAISLLDASTFRLVGCNRVFLQEYGLTEEEAIGKPCFALTHHRRTPCEPPNHHCPLQETARTGTTAEALHVHFTRQGERRFVEISTTPIRDENGVVVQAVHVARDITERRRAEDIIRFQIRLEKLINSISANLINLPADEIDAGIQYALRAVCEFNQVDRCYLLRFDDTASACHTVHEWCRDGMASQRDVLERLPVAEFTWMLDRLRRIETVILPSVDDLPVEATTEKGFFAAQAIESFIAVPMTYNGGLKGFLGFDSVLEKKIWGKECIAMLQIVAEILTNAIERGKAAAALRESLREKEVLLREIHHRVKNNMQVVSSLLDLQADYTRDAEHREMFAESRNRIRSMALIHEKLYRSKDLAKIDLADYIHDLARSLFDTYGVDTARISLQVEVQSVDLKMDTAISCGLILNELISNALKYAFPAGQEGVITVALRELGAGVVELVVRDNGVGLPAGLDVRNTDSLGLQLVVSVAEHQLGGKVAVRQDQGTEIRITVQERHG
ncbi:MAG: PAS domain S-box protein [Thermodesulfobacteriota bacterium]